MKIKLIMVCMVSLLGLSACFNNSSNSNPAKNNIESFSQQNIDKEPVQIVDADLLKSDLNLIFGDADSEPKAVEDGDSVQDVIDR
jgi:hypothetical protein